MSVAAERQRTLVRPTAEVRGTALHSGKPAMVRLEPAPAGTGLVFRRIDAAGSPVIPALAENVASTTRSTSLAANGAKVGTVEHVLAACSLAGLVNAFIEAEGDEIPAADGSALVFYEMILRAGLAEQGEGRDSLAVSRKVAAGEPPGPSIMAEPAPEPEVRFKFRGGGALDGRVAVCGPGGLAPRDIAAARTFCYEDEVPSLLAGGLGRGGNADNVLVLRRDGSAVNSERGREEAVRHKLLDLVGDLALAGTRVVGRVTAEGTGHALHVEFVRALRRVNAAKED